jgi:uncharacterized protein YggE
MDDKKLFMFRVGAVGAICLTILLSTVILSNGNFYIKNLGASLDAKGAVANSISVSGDGKVFATPDVLNLTISASETAGTSAEALQIVNQRINAAAEVLRNNGVDVKDIQTSNLSVYPEYDYVNGSSVLRGQRASVSINAKIKGIDAKAEKASKIIDEVSKIEKIELGSLSFDIEDKTALFTEARKLAFDKAKQKATELSGLAGVNLLDPISISDATYDIVPPSPVYKNIAEDSRASGNATSLSTGQLEVSVSLSVLFGID